MGVSAVSSDENLIADYAAIADDVFAGVKRLFPCTSEDRLAFAVRLPASHFEALHRASEKFTRRTLEEHGIDAGDGNVFLALRDHVAELTSLTSNGALMPRSEVDEEFNELQRVIAALFEDFGCEAVFDRGQCPVNLRFSMPPTLASLAASRHPYQSLKMHSDVWAGEPIDFVNCNIPVFLDGKAMNLELAEASPAL